MREDIDALVTLFTKKLSFDVMLHQNLESEEMITTVKEFAMSEVHANRSCVMMIVLSHGKTDTVGYSCGIGR
ncbi:hypothetical protein PENTCL1PPCAC_26132 [Pristionchus entomophagus]|uniref:Caspase family p20 domain-containing protein n=1 Tax=Pristionchus entomophagus TaxID=358040 RepID=A0AAV5UC16_9BILA|nr:hypothetical protein PENTCL1PPCAC_26132 [Pristionchus entomophagus]